MGEGNERFRGLLEPVYAHTLAFARHISSSSSDGDDLFQEALIRALCKLDRLRDEAAFKPWHCMQTARIRSCGSAQN